MPREKMREKPGAVWGWVGLGWGGGVSGREREGCALWRAARAAPPAGERERKKTKKGKNKRNCSCWRGPGRPGQRRAACSTPAGAPGTGRPRRRRRWTGRCRRRCRPSEREGEERRGARRGEWWAQGSACAAPASLPLPPPPSQPLTPATMVASCSKPPTREATPDTFDCEWGGGGGREWRVGA